MYFATQICNPNMYKSKRPANAYQSFSFLKGYSTSPSGISSFPINSSICQLNTSSTPWRTCCEVRVMLCMTFFFCAPLQSAGGFILEGDWTPTKTNLYYSPPIEVGVSSTFKMNLFKAPSSNVYSGVRNGYSSSSV